MSQLLERLAWDSEFFSLPIGRIVPSQLDRESLMSLLAEARAEGFRCLYFEVNPNDPALVALVERHHFHLVDVRVVLEHPFDNRPGPTPRYPISPDLVINLPDHDDLPHLQDISAQIGQTSRFAFDKNFVSQADRLYHVWIKNACQGFADIVLIARWHETGEPIGLISCTLRDGMGHIQLAGVHSEHRQRSVGTGLVQAALDWTKAQGAHGMQVVTQARNVPAQRLYQQMGFFTRVVTLYYHKWL